MSRWPIVPLSEALKTAEVFTDGDWVESKDQDPDGDVRLIQLADVGDGEYINKSARFLTSSKATELRCTILKKGDILVARMPDPLGRACIFPGDAKPAVTVVDICIIRPNGAVHPRWLMHCLNSPARRAEISQFATGTTRSRISRGNLAKIRVPLPPVEDQTRVVRILDAVDALRAKRRAALVQLDTLSESIFLDMFGDPMANPKRWARVPFSTILDKIEGGWSPTCLDRPANANEWGVLKLGAVTGCKFDAAENKALPPHVEAKPSLEIRSGDILFTRKNTRDLVAACALVRSTRPKLMISDLIFRFRLREGTAVVPIFLQRLLTFPTKRREIQRLAGGSAGSMPNISKARLEQVLIELPPVHVQREFARRVERIETLKTRGQEALVILEGLFSSLQHRAFRGEL